MNKGRLKVLWQREQEKALLQPSTTHGNRREYEYEGLPYTAINCGLRMRECPDNAKVTEGRTVSRMSLPCLPPLEV